MKVLLIGANGQLAQDIRQEFAADPRGDTLLPVTHDQLEIRDPVRVRESSPLP